MVLSWLSITSDSGLGDGTYGGSPMARHRTGSFWISGPRCQMRPGSQVSFILRCGDVHANSRCRDAEVVSCVFTERVLGLR